VNVAGLSVIFCHRSAVARRALTPTRVAAVAAACRGWIPSTVDLAQSRVRVVPVATGYR